MIALGGNALLDPTLPPTVANQFAITARAMVPVVGLIERGVRVVLTHGNGPQVGFMQMRSELARPFMHDVPLDSLVADTEGALGYMIECDLREELRRRGRDDEVATVVTLVEVDRGDPALSLPTKPVGRWFTREQAEALSAERRWRMVEDVQRGWRRVVPSPVPRAILSLPAIRRLARAGTVVIACGGGGIPVTRDADGRLRGIEAVIDKDRTSAMLANALGALRLVMTTGVDAIYRGFATPQRTALRETNVAELTALAAAGEFPAGSMGPKVEAAIDFLAAGGRDVIVCRPDALLDAFRGRAGTRIHAE